jgi:hypothetical protein
MVLAFLIYTTVASIVLAEPLSIQPCYMGDNTFAPLVWAYSPTSMVFSQASGRCLGVDTDGSPGALPCSGDASQQWILHSDGTVESRSHSGQCLNVDGGQTGVGTGIILYSCGSKLAATARAMVAANDVFAYLAPPISRIFANESGLCLSSAAPPAPPPGPCQGDLDCSLNGECVSGKCVCRSAWKGQQCELLVLQPVSFPQVPTCLHLSRLADH